MLLIYCFFFFFKQMTAYEMRISDWSSDVCSSDLSSIPFHLIRERPSMTTSRAMSLKSAVSREDIQLTPAQLGYFNARAQSKAHATVLDLFSRLAEIGRASCRERVCQYV